MHRAFRYIYASSLPFYNWTTNAAPADLKPSDQLVGQSVLRPRHSDSEAGIGEPNWYNHNELVRRNNAKSSYGKE